MTYIASWSGGKDSAFACYRAIQRGIPVSHLLNFISKEFRRVSFHGTEARLIQMQAEAVGIPLLQKETTPEGYEAEFKEAVRALLPQGVTGMVFGDLYLEEHKQWAERVTGELGIEAVEPLWGELPEKVISDFTGAGFVATITSAQADLIDREWIGRAVDDDFIAYLKAERIDICGENGEYHTVVTDGPLFAKRIEILEHRTIKRDNFWFLDTVKYRTVDKE